MRDSSADPLLSGRLPRGRLAAVLLGLVLVLVVASFYLADRALREASQDRLRAGRERIATAVGDELAGNLESLRTFYDSIGETDNRSSQGSGLGALDLKVVRLPIVPFSRIEVEDSVGRTIARYDDIAYRGDTEHSEERPGTSVPGKGRRSRRVRTVELIRENGPSQEMLVVSVWVRDITGSPKRIVGWLPADSLWRRTANTHGSLTAARAHIKVGSDTLVLHEGRRTEEGSVAVDSSWIDIAGFPDLSLSVSIAEPLDMARVALWCMGIGAMIVLCLGVVMDRSRVQRMADRSSELEHLSAELLRANKAKSEFLANVSHELRTPLNAIVGFVDLLRDGVYGELAPRQVSPVSRIEASATHLRYLVDQVLDLAKMAAGRLEVHAELVDLRPFVLEVAGEMEPLLAEKGLTLSIAVGATLPKVRIDPVHLRQILVNLLGNAVKFTSTGGVSVRARNAARREVASESRGDLGRRHEGPWVALQVIDSGIGIPRREWERIFDEFEQVNAGPRGDSMRRGTGLGLSISRRLARLMDGDVTVESEEGKGSVFTIWLPAEPRATIRAAPPMGVA